MFSDTDIHGASWLIKKNEQFARENRQVLIQGKKDNNWLRADDY